MIGLNSRLRRQQRILKQQSDGTLVLFNLDGGQYYSLDEVGARVWDLCDGALDVTGIAAAIAKEFDAPLETIQADVLTLLAELANEKLVGETA